MWKLEIPDVSNREDEFNGALFDAMGRRLCRFSEKQKNGLFSAYETYDLASGRPSRSLLFARLGHRFLDAIREAYDQVQEGKRLALLRARLKLAATKCPYCGFGEVSDLDHHLPGSRYKAFAIYARNLVPCCHRCNNKKRTIAGDTPDAQFVHAYLDEIPQQPFLVAQIEFVGASFVVSFRISQCQGMTEDMFRRLVFQFERLELNSRYQAEVVEFMSDQRTGIEGAALAGPLTLRDFVERSHGNALAQRGANHWKTALWSALLHSDDFIGGAYKNCFGHQ